MPTARARGLAIVAMLSLAIVPGASQTPALRILSASPAGELTELFDAEQIRFVFSEPMVVPGNAPSGAAPPWIRFTPPMNGRFYWAGTDTLVLRPGFAAPLPYATRYTVRVDGSATSLAGRALGVPYELTFTTPTVRLLSAEWYRRNGRFDSPAVVALRFNQPVRPEDVAAHAHVALTPHAWTAHWLKAAARARWLRTDRAGLARFDAKVAAVRRVTSSADAVAVRLAGSWDEQRFPPAPSLVVLETSTPPPPEGWLTVTIDGAMPSLAGSETPRAHSTVVKLEPAFFVTGTSCPAVCDASDVPSVRFTRPVARDAAPHALAVTDVTGGASRRAVIPVRGVTNGIADGDELDLRLPDIGFDYQPPATTWRLRFDANLTARDGQTLGYPWTGFLRSTYLSPYMMLTFAGTVWEAGGGPLVPVHARNVVSLTQWIAPVTLASVMPRLLRQHVESARLPRHRSRTPRVSVTPDDFQKHSVDVSRVLLPGGTGLVWLTVAPAEILGPPQPLTDTQGALLQVTNLGISVKDGPRSTLVFVTRLDTGLPVPDARVAIVDAANVTRWQGTTDGDGVTLGPALPLPERDDSGLSFIVTAEKDGDAAFVASYWPRESSLTAEHRSDRVDESGAALRGTVFTDRAEYKELEEVHLKAVVREATPNGMRLLPPGTALDVVVRNAYRIEVDRRRIAVNRWSSAEWAWHVPESGAWAIGKYTIEMSRAGSVRPVGDPADVEGSFVVAAFPTPTFRVDATLTADPPVLGSTLHGTVAAKYLAGGALGARPLRWSSLRDVVQQPPAAILERYPQARYVVGYLPESRTQPRDYERLPQVTGLLDASDTTFVELPTVAAGDLAYSYTFEVDVENESGWHVASRAALVVHPASLYVAMTRLPRFVDTTAGQTVGIVAVDLSGRPVADVAVTVSLVREQWVPSHLEKTGWERREIPAGEWTVRTAIEETPLPIPLSEGGRYVLRALARDANGRQTRSELDFYALGPGVSSWRNEYNNIELTPERETWKPGEMARILIHSPWPRATALVTVERDGVRSHRVSTITSTQDTVDVPITEADVPNVYVSVMLVKGRTSHGPDALDGPSFRVGYTELSVDDPSKRLRVDVSADRDEYRPGGPATIAVAVTPHDGKPAPAEATLWALDQGLLSVTGYTTPDLLKAIYAPKPLEVMTMDNRQQLISRGPMRMTPGGVCCGVEGALFDPLSLKSILAQARKRSARDAFMAARDSSGVSIQQDVRPLVFWLGSVVTDAGGSATTTVTLPDSVATYRIMAVAGNEVSQFGFGEREIRVTSQAATVTVK